MKKCVQKRGIKKSIFKTVEDIEDFKILYPYFNHYNHYICDKCGFFHLTSYDQPTVDLISKIKNESTG